jgi:hypothetical protein
MKRTLYGTTALATLGLVMAALAGCEQTPADPNAPAKAEEPIKLKLGGYMNQSFGVGDTPDDE